MICRYPRLAIITYNIGSEFLDNSFFKLIKKEYGINTKFETTANLHETIYGNKLMK